jgi:hypothetical protein
MLRSYEGPFAPNVMNLTMRFFENQFMESTNTKKDQLKNITLDKLEICALLFRQLITILLKTRLIDLQINLANLLSI